MSALVKTSIIIYDDYNNVYIVQKQKSKKGELEIWSLIGKELKAKEAPEKCITKAAEHDLNSIIFNLTTFKEYKLNNENEILMVYSGKIKGKTVLHKSLYESKWVSVGDLETYNFEGNEKEIINEFFEKNKDL